MLCSISERHVDYHHTGILCLNPGRMRYPLAMLRSNSVRYVESTYYAISVRDTALMTNISCVKEFKRGGLRLLQDRAETLDFENTCELFDLSVALRLIRWRRAPSSTSRWNFRRRGTVNTLVPVCGAEKRRGKP